MGSRRRFWNCRKDEQPLWTEAPWHRSLRSMRIKPSLGTAVTVINAIGGNVIVNVKDSRIAVSREMAQKIMV